MENRVDRAGLSLRVMWVLLVIFAGYLYAYLLTILRVKLCVLL